MFDEKMCFQSMKVLSVNCADVLLITQKLRLI